MHSGAARPSSSERVDTAASARSEWEAEVDDLVAWTSDLATEDEKLI
jgi:hypothetical protein